MKILFTGGGTGGHFYPIIAMVQAINDIVEERKLVTPKYYYMSDSPYDEKALFEYNIQFRKVSAGKMRRYRSIKNLIDLPRTLWGILTAIVKLFFLYPDCVVGKGGYASFPTIFAAHFLGIPVVIHESDSIPGRVNLYGAKFAKRVGIAYEEATKYFTKTPADRIALVGIPIRRELAKPVREGAYEFLKLERELPVIYITGGSQGAQAINDVMVDIIPQLVEKYQIIHQVGSDNVAEIKERLAIVFGKSEHRDRYKMFGFLSSTAQAMAAGVAKLAITRAGSTSLYEIAQWGLPSIVIPIPKEVSHDQERNAYNYARTGAAVMIEEANLSDHIMLSEIDRIMGSTEIQNSMHEHAIAFAKPEAARKMAEAILDIVLSHER